VAVKRRSHDFIDILGVGMIAEWQNRDGFGRILVDNLLGAIITIFDKRKLSAAPA
jgi:hypothetical protein